MSAYSVATSSMGDRIWWVNWELGELSSYSDIRAATDEESALMEKVVWDRATESDCRQLRELIAQK